MPIDGVRPLRVLRAADAVGAESVLSRGAEGEMVTQMRIALAKSFGFVNAVDKFDIDELVEFVRVIAQIDIRARPRAVQALSGAADASGRGGAAATEDQVGWVRRRGARLAAGGVRPSATDTPPVGHRDRRHGRPRR